VDAGSTLVALIDDPPSTTIRFGSSTALPLVSAWSSASASTLLFGIMIFGFWCVMKKSVVLALLCSLVVASSFVFFAPHDHSSLYIDCSSMQYVLF
jgi:hypothetical protein